MSNIMDYLDWRGDIPFSVSPFNEVDNLILAEISYTQFEGIVPGIGKRTSISIEEAAEKFFELHSEEEFETDEHSSVMKAPLMLKKAAESVRFHKTKLSCYVNEIDIETQVQFSAVLFSLPDHTHYAAFRGTDHTIVGWKEDFNMSFLSRTPGQDRARRYLNDIGGWPFRRLRVGGHSKGGNFAVYGSTFADDAVKRRIIEVYSNDGPGFRPEVTESPEYQELLPKIHSIVPEHSIVGMILENAYEHKIVDSDASGLMQHDAMSWQVKGNSFVEVDSLGEDSKIFDETLRNWLEGIEDDKRSEFVDIVFDALTYDGSTTTEELKLSYTKTMSNMMKSIRNLPPEKQELFGDVLVRLAKSGAHSIWSEFRWNPRETRNARNLTEEDS